MDKELPKITLVDNKTLGQRITEIRKNKGFTQEELANKVGINRSTLADYELDRSRVFSSVITRLAIALEVSADRLLGLTDSEKAVENFSLRYTKRIKEIDSLSEYKRRQVLKALDDLIKANKE